ncbi:MAG TPA: mechanosensitive ion channel domain-containing protein [Rickettsiales bacterium]|nr:mechanosensitive ion channel domain-containing protein [Rickettsiales bacterium]
MSKAYHTHSGTSFVEALKEYSSSILYEPSMEIQIFLSLLSIVLAFPASMLIRRIARRKLQNSVKYGNLVNNILAYITLPSVVIFNLVASGWIMQVVIPAAQTHHIITSVTRIALVWFIARVLLLLAHEHFIAYFVSFIMLMLTLLSVTGLLAPTLESLGDVSFEMGKIQITLLDIIKGLFTLVILFWGAGVVSKTGENWLRRSHLSFNARELAIKFLRITLYFLAFVFTLTQMGVDLTALTVFGGAVAVGLGFGLQKITSNFLSGLVLLFEKAIEAGDLIEIGQEKGWVREMAIRHTLIETFDGREVLIPNEDLVIGKVTNWTYTNTRARIEILLTVTYDTDVDLARKILVEAAKEHRMCISEPPPQANLREFNERGIQIVLVFWIPDVTQGMVSTRSDVMINIVRAFRDVGIKFAEGVSLHK